MTTHDAAKTIEDFGEQWTRYGKNCGYYASAEALTDIFGPLLGQEDIEGKLVADVGAGTGRFVRMLHALGAKGIFALEPSAAFEVLKQNTSDLDGIEYMQETADRLPDRAFDLIFCIGVLQFIPDPAPALRAMGRALAPGGRLYFWVYGVENNRLYISLIRPLRAVTTRLPHPVLSVLCSGLRLAANLYAALCRFLPLPLGEYMRGYFARLDLYSRKLVIYDQLNPKTTRYYTRDELLGLLRDSGFEDIETYHRLGYSWSVRANHKGA
jgi:SAM-dependent methyltransferase